jgi:UDP-glucose 4-epimerase
MKQNKVLVTGGSGFIGSHVADTLEEEGYQVVLFDTVPSEYKSQSQEEFIGDILIPGEIEKAMEGCDLVYHFAAQADIGASSDIPTRTIMANIIGTQNVLEVARKHEVKRFMFASTIYVYSELGSFYRVSKQACEKIIEEYQREFDLDYTILRYGSLYGSRANEFNFIANSILQALKNKKIVRRGDGEEIREYIHVKDAARLSLDAIDDKFRNKHLIITGHQQIKVKDLLIMIKEIFGGEIEIEFSDEEELLHYEITPYNYKPQVAKKIIPDTYYDLGQGLMDQIYDLGISMDKENGSKKVSLLKRKK